MSVFQEYDWLMQGTPSADISVHNGANAIGQRILEWLGTPENTHVDLMGWGNNLGNLKHHPIGDELKVMAEMTLFRDLRRDIKDLDLRGISIDFLDVDTVQINLMFGNGEFFSTVVSL